MPFFFGRPYLAVALLLFVSLCYVKVFKFRQQLADLAERGGDPERKAVLLHALQRWQALTFLKND
jgi:hypothetical protein